MRLFAVLSSAVVWIACADQGPTPRMDQPGTILIIGSGEAGRITLVSRSTLRVLATLPVAPLGHSSISADSSILYTTGLGELAAIDLRTFRAAWRLTLSTAAHPIVVDDVEIGGDNAVATSPDHSKVFVSFALSGGRPGIAVLDVTTGAVRGFVGPFTVVNGGLHTLPPGAATPAGAILVQGRRGSASESDSLWILDPDLLTFTDSMRVVAPGASSSESIGLGRAYPDRRHVLLLTTRALLKYDLVTHQVVRSAARHANGSVAIAPTGDRVVETDVGDFFDSPGSGMLFEYDGELGYRRAIDLRDSSGGRPVSRWATFSEDGRFVYVSSGTASRGPLFGPQPARVIVVDLVAVDRRSIIPLPGDWLPGQVYAR